MTSSSSTSDLLAVCADLRVSGTPSPELIAVTRAFVGDIVKKGRLDAGVLEALDELPPHGSAWLAVSIGTAVENGFDPAHAGERLVETFRSTLRRTAGGEEPLYLEALPTLAQSVVAHVARLDGLRDSLAADAEFVALLSERESDSYAITWIRELVARRTGDLFVVHADTRRVVHLRFHNVAGCFHLFSLLQSVLGSALPGGDRPNEAVFQAARGQSDEPVTDRASWHFQTAGTKPSMAKAVFGEESVDALRRDDGTYALSLWEPLLGDRQWNSGFFGPALEAAPSDMLFIAELKGAEAAEWADRVLCATRS